MLHLRDSLLELQEVNKKYLMSRVEAAGMNEAML